MATIVPLTTTSQVFEIVKVSAASQGLLVLILAGPPYASPLHLGAISVQETAAITGLTGTISDSNDSNKPGKANLQAGSVLFASLYSVATSKGKKAAQLTYETRTETPTSLIITLI